jgi:two-component system sensor histidine kinase KdpD
MSSESVTQRERRALDLLASAVAGVGLGLAICRAIVEAHDGTILAESRQIGGARFIIALPLGEPPELGIAGGDEEGGAKPA